VHARYLDEKMNDYRVNGLGWTLLQTAMCTTKHNVNRFMETEKNSTEIEHFLTNNTFQQFIDLGLSFYSGRIISNPAEVRTLFELLVPYSCVTVLPLYDNE
jgi:hypothetical protein